jgi:hypothetical protein
VGAPAPCKVQVSGVSAVHSANRTGAAARRTSGSPWHGVCPSNGAMPDRPGSLSRRAHHRADSLPWSLRLVLALGVILVIAVWGWLRNADSRALSEMDPDLRRELFLHTRAEAEELCERTGLGGECQERLRFLSRFPECDEGCRSFVGRHRAGPSR